MTSLDRSGYRSAVPGDVNAFFGLVVDNLTNLVVLSGPARGRVPLSGGPGPYRIVPGTALGVLIGDVAYTWLAVRLAREISDRSA